MRLHKSVKVHATTSKDAAGNSFTSVIWEILRKRHRIYIQEKSGLEHFTEIDSLLWFILLFHQQSATGSEENSVQNSEDKSNRDSKEESEDISAENSENNQLQQCSKENLNDNCGDSFRTDESSDTSQITVLKVHMLGKGDSSVDRSSTLTNTVSIQSTFSSSHEGCAENGCEFVEDLSFSHKDAPKKVRFCTWWSYQRFKGCWVSSTY